MPECESAHAPRLDLTTQNANRGGTAPRAHCDFFESGYTRRMATSRASTRVADAERLREQAQRLADAASTARTGKAPTVAALGLDDVVLPPSVLEAAAEVLREQAQGRESEIVVVRETLSAQQ